MLKRKYAVILLLLALCACSDYSNYAPVENRSRMAAISADRYYVQSGDTLYSIAWASELDYRQLAKMNHLKPPYALHPGDILKVRLPPLKMARLDPPHRQSSALPKSKIMLVKDLPKPKTAQKKLAAEKKYLSKSTTKKGNLKHENRDVSQVRKPGVARISASFANGIKSQKQPQIHDSKNPNNEKSEQAKRKDLIFTKKSVHSFMWPTKGRIVGQFSSGQLGNKGIDIVGQFGQPVRASESGLVVYSGSGLRGYGNLIIIKHNASFLSAYAHNAELKVTEGSRVKAGQEIATMGRATSGKSMLHFEIRRDGKPVNPIQYLR